MPGSASPKRNKQYILALNMGGPFRAWRFKVWFSSFCSLGESIALCAIILQKCVLYSEAGHRGLFSCRLLGINYQQDAKLHSLPDTGDKFTEIEGFL